MVTLRKHFAKNETLLVIGSLLGLVLFVILPYLLLKEDAYIRIHDNLDSEFIYLHLLKMQGLLFDTDAVLPNVMEGIPTRFFHSERSFTRVIFYLFPSSWAYVITSVLVRIVGFIGMYILLRDYLLKENKFLQILFSVTFALIPLYVLYHASITGQPLLLWAFLNLIHNNKKIFSYVIIFLLPFYMHFILIGPFVLVAIFLWGLYKYKLSLFKTPFFLGLLLLTFSFLLTNIGIILGFFLSEVPSHRTEFKTLLSDIPSVTNVFFILSPANQTPIFYIFLLMSPVVLGALIISRESRKILLPLSIALLFIYLFNGIYPYWVHYLNSQWHISVPFQFNRFTFLLPFLWFLMLSLAIKYLLKKVSSVLLSGFVFFILLGMVYLNDEIYLNYKKVIAKYLSPAKYEDIDKYAPGFIRFYSSHVFTKIDSIIHKPKGSYKVASVGIHPAIAQYHGFHTVDGYQNNYPLSYKKKFRKVIAEELEKNKELKEYFDNWGSRCYVFSADLKNSCYMDCRKDNKDSIKIDLNIQALKELGTEYIFSAVYIKNYKDLNLELMDYISHPKDLYGIYLYKIK